MAIGLNDSNDGSGACPGKDDGNEATQVARCGSHELPDACECECARACATGWIGLLARSGLAAALGNAAVDALADV